MMEYDMMRNGSGYYDETPVKTGLFGNTPQPGEIWESSQGKETLVLKNHGAFCTTLFVRNEAHSDTMEVISREVRHVNPAMLGYIFNRDLAIYIKTIPQETFLDIMQAVGERLGVTIKVSREEEADEVPNDYIIENGNLAAELEGIKIRYAALDKEHNNLQQKYDEVCKELQVCQLNEGHISVVDAVKAEMYESLYKELLQKCLARGEAK